MNELRKAANMALEALEKGTTGLAIRAIPALRQALAQDEQVGFNGLTESETEQTMSVKGLSTEQEPVTWIPFDLAVLPYDEIDVLMGDGSVLTECLRQFDDDIWWSGAGTGEKFIDPRFCKITHYRLHDKLNTAPSKPEQDHFCDTHCVHTDHHPDCELAQPEKEPMSFQTWRSRQHGDPEEIGFLQALKHAYESGQYSVSPPRKEWVGLTDEDMEEAIKTADYNQGQYKRTPYWAHLATAIEAKLKEKNT